MKIDNLISILEQMKHYGETDIVCHLIDRHDLEEIIDQPVGKKTFDYIITRYHNQTGWDPENTSTDIEDFTTYAESNLC